MACGCGGSQQGGQGGSGSGARGVASKDYFWNGPKRPKPAAEPKPKT